MNRRTFFGAPTLLLPAAAPVQQVVHYVPVQVASRRIVEETMRRANATIVKSLRASGVLR